MVIRAGGDGREDYGGEFSGSFKPFSLTSSRNKLRIRVPPIYGNKSHAFTFNITSTDTPGLLLFVSSFEAEFIGS